MYKYDIPTAVGEYHAFTFEPFENQKLDWDFDSKVKLYNGYVWHQI